MASAYAIELPTFDICNFTDRLTAAQGKNRWECPACGGDNLTFDPNHYQGYTCWNDESDQHRREIKEALSPIEDAIAQAKAQQGSNRITSTRAKPFKPRAKATLKPASLPSRITLAKLSASATDAPQPHQQPHPRHGQVLVWRFPYSDRQWIERIQWVDPTKAKGYDKDYYPFYLADDGEEIPIKQRGKTVGQRSANPNETICGKGKQTWKPYRLDEAVAAAQTDEATAILLLEGEPCVEVARSLGLVAITLPGQGWGKEAIATAIEPIRAAGKTIVMLPDHDKTGTEKAAKVEAACTAAGVPYLQLDPAAIDAQLEEHGDIANMVERMGANDFIARLEAEIHRQVELRRQSEISNGQPPDNGGSGGDGGGDDGGGGGDGEEPIDRHNPDLPFREICTALGLAFQHCCTRQQFDGSAYRALFGGEAGDWTVINAAFYHWNGRYWECKSDTAINKMIADYGEQAFKVNFDREGNAYITRPYETNKHKESAFKYCRSRLERSGAAIANAHLLAFNDGVVDLRTGQTMPHSKDFLLTNLIPHDYQPDCDCPSVFRDFIVDSFGEEMLPIVRAFTAMFLDPTAPYGRFPHLIGKSGGGKGTLGRFWSSLFGIDGSGSATAFSDIATPEGRHQYLTGKRIFGFPDMGGYSQGLRAFYELLDNGAMTGRALFSPTAYSVCWNIRFWVASVDHLQIENAGDGWARRAYPMPVRQREVMPDPDLKHKLEAVKAEVIAWALAMPRAERDAVLLSPPTTEQAKNFAHDAALYGDSTRSFVELCLRPSRDAAATITPDLLHSFYEAYCRIHGYSPLAQSKFISHLRTVLPRNYKERSWSLGGKADRVRIPAHWIAIVPLNGVFVCSSSSNQEFQQNPQWTCLKAQCREGGLEQFEAFWNPSADPALPPASDTLETLKPLLSNDVQCVQVQNDAQTTLDTLKPLPSNGVQCGSTVQSKSFASNFGSVEKASEAVDAVEIAEGRPTEIGQSGHAGHPLCETVAAIEPTLDTPDTLDIQPELLSPDRLAKAVAMLGAIDSPEAFRVFYQCYQKKTQAQKDQIIAAASEADVMAFYEWWNCPDVQAIAVALELKSAQVAAASPEMQFVSEEAIEPTPAPSSKT